MDELELGGKEKVGKRLMAGIRVRIPVLNETENRVDYYEMGAMHALNLYIEHVQNCPGAYATFLAYFAKNKAT